MSLKCVQFDLLLLLDPNLESQPPKTRNAILIFAQRVLLQY